MIYQPDQPFALSVSDETDKSSEDPDVVLQTLKKFLQSLSSVFFLQFYLSEVFLVGEVIHQKNFFQKLCRGPKRYIDHHSFNLPCHYFDPDLLITLCMVLSKTDLPSLWKTITTEACSRANISIIDQQYVEYSNI